LDEEAGYRRKNTLPAAASASGDEEKVLSGLEVEALLRVGREHLLLLFTQNRLILAHQGKTGRSAVPLYGLLGKMSEGLRRMPAKKGLLRSVADMKPSRILSLHAENFSLDYSKVVSMMVQPDVANNNMRITLVTPDQKYELYASQVAVEGVREFVQSVLSDRVEFRR
jgi:hypothetical protein